LNWRIVLFAILSFFIWKRMPSSLKLPRKARRAIDKWALHSRVLYWLATMNGGERAWAIDEVPLDWFYRPGVKLDFRDFSDGHVVTAAEVAGRVEATGHELKPLDIVPMNTRAGAAYDTPAYIDSGCGSDARLPYGCSNVACGSWEPTAGAGTLRSLLRAADSWNRGIRRSFGRATRQVPISGTARLKSWRTSNSCQQPVSWSRVFRSRSRARPQGLRRRGDHMTPTTRPNPAFLLRLPHFEAADTSLASGPSGIRVGADSCPVVYRAPEPCRGRE
jgi:hypothetical protein